MSSYTNKDLQTFENPQPDRDFTVRIDTPEFTCLCPLTGQPDFAKITIEYVPNKHCIELKSLKLYFWGFRERGVFHEAVSNEILNDLVAIVQPHFMRIQVEFNVRGGLYTTVVVEHRHPDWHAAESVQLP